MTIFDEKIMPQIVDNFYVTTDDIRSPRND